MFSRIMSMVMGVILLVTVGLTSVCWMTLRNQQINARLKDLTKEAREIAYLAAQQCTDGELAILESILGKLKAAIQAGDILSIFEYDRAFHDDLARAAHNPILFACLQTIEEINEACVKRYDKFLIMLDDCYNEHFQIFTAVANQQPEKAQAAMAQHARSSKKILL